MQKVHHLQEDFLTLAQSNALSVTIFLMNGFQLRGVITGFDAFVVVLTTDQKQQMIYKHAISTIVPERSLDLFEAPCGADRRS